MDDTIERRWGVKIRTCGIHRDPVRSSQSQIVKANGLCWSCIILLVSIPWAQLVWALPFLSALSPSGRYHAHSAGAAKKLTDCVWQVLLQVRRWSPQ